MAVYIVTYDLNKEPSDANRAALRTSLQQFAWARLSESCYAVEYGGTAKQLYDQLRQHLDQNDFLFVVPAQGGWYGYGKTDVVQWLSSRLAASQ